VFNRATSNASTFTPRALAVSANLSHRSLDHGLVATSHSTRISRTAPNFGGSEALAAVSGCFSRHQTLRTTTSSPPLRFVFRSLNGDIASNSGHLWQFEIKAKLRVESSQLAHRKDYLYHCHPHICPHPGRFPALWLLVNGRAGQHLVMRRRTSHPVGKATAT
jgi:hypothetical protein